MSNQFGEDWQVYIWPTEHKDGTPFPEDMHERLSKALHDAGFSWEHV